MHRLTRRQVIRGTLAGLGSLGLGPQLAGASGATLRESAFHFDHVIGTSLDCWVLSDRDAGCALVEHTVLREIERLRLIFSTYDPSSEISWLNRSAGPTPCSAAMLDVLRACDRWRERTGGAFNGRLGELERLWMQAEAAGVEPRPQSIREIVNRIADPAWSIDESTGTVTRLSDQSLNLNSIAKGYIIEHAFAMALANVPGVAGLLLNLGGDVRLWRRSGTWHVAVQDPFQPFDNASPLAVIAVGNGAIATSGGYLRGYTVVGQRRSHLFDPRTGMSADRIASATVFAADNLTANALATSLCVMNVDDGLRLIREMAGVECLIVTSAGEQLRSAGWRALETDANCSDERQCAAVESWPNQFQLTVSVELPRMASPRYRRPYVAVWIEDAQGKPVRTLGVWGNSPKYLRDLSYWWKNAQGNQALIRAVTRATRSPGKYDLVWDGRDDSGKAAAQGTYTVKVEVHREHGKHLLQSGKIECNGSPSKITLAKNAETEITTVEYGKKK